MVLRPAEEEQREAEGEHEPQVIEAAGVPRGEEWRMDRGSDEWPSKDDGARG